MKIKKQVILLMNFVFCKEKLLLRNIYKNHFNISAKIFSLLSTLSKEFFQSSLFLLYKTKLILPAMIFPKSEVLHEASLTDNSSIIINLSFKLATFQIASKLLEPYFVAARSRYVPAIFLISFSLLFSPTNTPVNKNICLELVKLLT